MNYQQLVIQTTKDNTSFIEEVALGLGALSVDFSDTFDNPILEPTLGTTPLWNDVTLKILFSEDVDTSFVQQSLIDICDVSGEFECIADKNWQKECNKNFTITQYGDKSEQSLWICPSWEDCSELTGKIIKMDPGMAFGTGSHQTTSLCLEYLANNAPTNKVILDFGCGTGILAIAAKKLGAIEVLAIDNDPQAILATTENAQHNGESITTMLADNSRDIPQVDVIIANVLTPVLVDFASDFAKLLRTSGSVILSGILESQEEQIYTEYSKYFTHLQTYKKDEWLLISAFK